MTQDGLDALQAIYEQAVSRSGPISLEDLNAIISENEELGLALHLGDADSVQMSEGIAYEGSKYGTVYQNGVLVLDLIGPIYPRANMMTSSGATSIAQFTKDFATGYSDPNVTGIVMHVDSPGGDVRGIADAAQFIHMMSKKRKKPVKAFGSGLMASAAYYIASTAQEIIGSNMSISGSIGVVLTGQKNDAGQIEIVSSQSPNKRPDIETQKGKALLQERVDDLAEIFINDVALYRGITPEKVVSKYGEGGTMVGPRAKAAGLIDKIGTLSSVVESVAKEAQSGSYRQASTKKRPTASADVAELLKFNSEDIETMGLEKIVGKFKASAATIFDQTDDTAQSSASNESEGTPEGAEPGQEPVVQIATREELEDKFADAAELFVTQMTIGNHILPAQQGHAASLFLMARIDDELHGGKVMFVDKTGGIAEGTREEAVRAAFEAMPTHSLTKKAVAGIRAGTVTASVLKEAEAEGKDKEDDGPMSPDRRTELLAASAQGQNVLARNRT